MADALCGPSNGAKNLVNHVNRDRSLQQDRMINGAPGASQSSFRSQSANAHAADQAFAGFLQNGLPPAAQIPMSGNAGFVGDLRSATPTSAPIIQHPQGPSWAGPAQASVASHRQDWVDQFSSMQVSGSNAQMTSPAVPRLQNPLFNTGGVINAQQLGFAASSYTSSFTGMQSGFYSQGASPMVAPNVYGSQQQAMPAQPESTLDMEAFNAAFGEYDDAEFSQELASWAAKDESETMAEEATQNGATQGIASDPAVDQEVVNQPTPEQEEAARRRQQDKELADAANHILLSVSENDSEKFKKSNFFELMRRIGNHEVVATGENLVDAATGEAVVPKETQGSEEGAGVEVRP